MPPACTRSAVGNERLGAPQVGRDGLLDHHRQAAGKGLEAEPNRRSVIREDQDGVQVRPLQEPRVAVRFSQTWS